MRAFLRLVVAISVFALSAYMIWTGKMLSPGRLGAVLMGLLILVTTSDPDPQETTE